MGGQSTVTVLTAGPERATEAIRQGAVDGADRGVHLLDANPHGSGHGADRLGPPARWHRRGC